MRSLGFKLAGVGAVIAALIALIAYVHELREDVQIAEQNRIASVEMYNNEKNKTYALNLKIEDLDRIKNKQIQEMDSIRRALNVKDKQLKALYGQKSSADIRDTIELPIYVPVIDSTTGNVIPMEDCYTDTCVGDMRWYNVCIDRIDSNLIVLSAHFESDLTLITVEKKEIVNKPRKTWLGRLFQRKVKTMSITAVEQNPYVRNDSTILVVPIK